MKPQEIFNDLRKAAVQADEPKALQYMEELRREDPALVGARGRRQLRSTSLHEAGHSMFATSFGRSVADILVNQSHLYWEHLSRVVLPDHRKGEQEIVEQQLQDDVHQYCVLGQMQWQGKSFLRKDRVLMSLAGFGAQATQNHQTLARVRELFTRSDCDVVWRDLRYPYRSLNLELQGRNVLDESKRHELIVDIAVHFVNELRKVFDIRATRRRLWRLQNLIFRDNRRGISPSGDVRVRREKSRAIAEVNEHPDQKLAEAIRNIPYDRIIHQAYLGFLQKY